MGPLEKIACCLTVLIAIVKTTQWPGETCAESCSCTAVDTDWGSAVNVQCVGRNLASVPIIILDKPVSHLDLSFNVLKILEEDALLSYQSLRYLYLQRCRIVNINEKAFQSLQNLTVIDLSSNRLTSVHPNLFSGNQLLDTLILRGNNLDTLKWNTPILNGPPSLSSIDLQSCKLSNISSITFSLLPNLTFIDISRNKLTVLHNDTLSSHHKLKDVILEKNPWKCGAVFKGLMCWMHIKLTHSNTRTVQCQYKNKTWEKWSAENRSLLCDSDSTRSDTPPHKLDSPTSTTPNPPHKLDSPTSTTPNPPHKLDSPTSTTPNPPHKLDSPTSTTPNPSHKLDSPTSTTPNPPRTPSHELDIPTYTTVNTETPVQEDPGTTSSSLLFWVLFVMCAILFLLLAIVFVIRRKNGLLFGGLYQAVDKEGEEA